MQDKKKVCCSTAFSFSPNSPKTRCQGHNTTAFSKTRCQDTAQRVLVGWSTAFFFQAEIVSCLSEKYLVGVLSKTRCQFFLPFF